MGQRRDKYPRYENLEIIDIAAEGKAIAKKDEMVVFVTNAIPGDVVDVQINKRKRNFKEGYPVKFHHYSEKRVDAFCSHFGLCGGCKWQMLPYEEQLHYKQKQVSDQLSRIGHLTIPEISPILRSQKTIFYRNKLEYTFSKKRWFSEQELVNDPGPELRDNRALGFHIPGMYDRILNIDNCYLQPEPSNKIRLAVAKFARENDYGFYDQKEKKGYLRNLIIRTTSLSEVMVIVAFQKSDEDKQEALLSYLKNEFPEITSLMYIINGKVNDSLADQEVHFYAGRDHIFEEMEGLRFKIGAKSFYQTNSEQAYELYKVAREFAQLTGKETVYDLYTGTGTIANFIASKAKKVVGIEYVPEAIEDAKVNSALNRIENTSFFAGDMKDILTAGFIEENGRPEVIILDPPRAGIHTNVIDAMLAAKPDRIVYVSCNPATQARDLSLMKELYSITKIQPVDMFPHTHHVENVVLLERNAEY
ncbi:MAG: 23S rRNA (uracil(1939)-C(5))-methyltransferase RlmD [Bacteroidales bacterium]|nr:23S rRNA (uracil(1939)-C(5))-methyltransferase RlmD [Bacteroidales bacterium]MCF8458059.1 23S rRNA (uracil(1939)-C(5))-methyltransferase RlmD [Bacteroidales bacterium]